LLQFDCDIQDPVELIRLGLCDPMKLFIKEEPHKATKLKEKRFRLIFSVSLIDNLIARILCMPQNSAEIATWYKIPLKPGMGLGDDCLRILNQVVYENQDGGIDEADISGWDWSFQAFDFEMDYLRRIHLAVGELGSYKRILRAHFHCMARKVVVLSDGTMYAQNSPGIMPSGWYNTSSTNSAARAMNHYYVALANDIEPWCITMGDDAVERHVPNASEWYLRLGKTCKMMRRANPYNFEFCSQHFNGMLATPTSVDKQLVNMLVKLPRTWHDYCSRFEQFKYEMRNHPELHDFIKLLEDAGWWDSMPDPLLFIE
jgi:hypothetical protein